MHELSIALSLLELVEEESLRRPRARIAAIHLKLGPLSGVVKEALLSAYTLAREQTTFPDCNMLIEEIPITVHCPKCEADRPVVSLQEIACAVCRTPTPQILTGRELEVTALEIIE